MKNKARRHEIKMLKYKKRLKNYRLKEGEGNFYAFRSHGSPCSCFVCSHSKYKRAGNFRKRTTEEIEADRCSAYEYLIP